jgi:CubicO group peptidase (beta-lactamase class C family)
MSQLHLAQVDIARMKGPLESPVMAGFPARLDEINALADGSPGFVWRLQTEEGNATYLRPYDDDRILFNLSVWESIEHLRDECAASPFGYGYQWWLHAGAFSAIGIYNQYVWVDPTRRVIVAKLSATPTYGQSCDEAGYRDQEHMTLFNAVAAKLQAS